MGHGLLIYEVSRSHTASDTPQSVGPLSTGDQFVAETSTLQHTTLLQETNIHASGGIRNRNPKKRAAADPRLRPPGHWDRRKTCLYELKWMAQMHNRLFVMVEQLRRRYH